MNLAMKLSLGLAILFLFSITAHATQDYYGGREDVVCTWPTAGNSIAATAATSNGSSVTFTVGATTNLLATVDAVYTTGFSDGNYNYTSLTQAPLTISSLDSTHIRSEERRVGK